MKYIKIVKLRFLKPSNFISGEGYTEVSSFQGVGIERFFTVYQCPQDKMVPLPPRTMVFTILSIIAQGQKIINFKLLLLS